MNSRRVLRHTVPVDDRWHEIEFDGPIIHVDTRSADVMEFWTDSLIDERIRPVAPRALSFRVFGTGHAVPNDPAIKHVGSAITEAGALVWHLFSTEATQ